jgi:hypothetical protein
MALSDIDAQAVLKAIEEFDRLGQNAFFEKIRIQTGELRSARMPSQDARVESQDGWRCAFKSRCCSRDKRLKPPCDLRI